MTIAPPTVPGIPYANSNPASPFLAANLAREPSVTPASAEMMATVVSAKALLGKDDNFKRYISWADGNTDNTASASVSKANSVTLEEAIIKGMRDTAADLTDALLEAKSPIEIINAHIVPALDEVGKKYESGKIYLPGLLLSAETSKCAFERIKARVNKGSSNGVRIVIATVKGDIHDIGKNIVKLLLENYGFEVYDLGKDVPSTKIVETAISRNCEIVALSALMTTTVSAMEEVISELKKQAPSIKIIVGGAVLTEDYAKKIGADAYAKDAMGAVRYAEKFLEK
jgi:5-methyltetrahydrofolate--homocysteine methyltransferase